MVEAPDLDTNTPEVNTPIKKNNLIVESAEDFNRMLDAFFQYLRKIDIEARELQAIMDNPHTNPRP